MRKKALYNRCPECQEEVFWMPYEDRCGKCGFGGKPKNNYLDTLRMQKSITAWWYTVVPAPWAAGAFLSGIILGMIISSQAF